MKAGRSRAARLGVALTCVGLLGAPAAARAETTAPTPKDQRSVVLVGNNWEGTADIIDPVRLERLARINIIPDIEQRRAEINMAPDRLGFFLGIRALIGEGNDQFVDDMFTSKDGRYMFVSRPSLADVVGFDLSTQKIVWRVPMEGYRSDHMAISPDGTRLLVSDSTAAKVHVIDTKAGKIVGNFLSGDQPHENNYSADGKRIFHASIGSVFTPTDDPLLDAAKGKRYFQIVDAESLKILRRIEVGKRLAAEGRPGYSSAVRPMAISPDERFVYMQLSFLHGFVEYDVQEDKFLRIAHLPLSDVSRNMRRDEYVLDSAHHGLAMNPRGTKLCVAGTMSNYAAIVHRDDFSSEIIPVGDKPYWSTNSADGKNCYVSVSGEDRLAVISYRTEKEIGSVPVGDHPQRVRNGTVLKSILPSLANDSTAPRLRTKVVRRKRGKGRALRVRASERARLTVKVQRVRRGARGSGRRFKQVRTIRRSVRKGRSRVGLGKLARPARYRLVIRAEDSAGNDMRRKVVRFRMRGRR